MSQHPLLSAAVLNGTHVQFLEQLSDTEFWQYAEQLAKTPSMPAAQVDEYLECACVEGRVILPLASICEVLAAPRHYVQLPASPTWMLGVTTWKGEAVAVIDLGALLTQQPAQDHVDQVLLITHCENTTLAFTVTLSRTYPTIPVEYIQPFIPPEASSTNGLSEAIQGIYAGALVLNMASITTLIIHQLQFTAYE
ncbi:chemotaxis protein CheW [Dictyobacter arantiisoli]|uniref:CheW-like domain-containing protein n=1 Tax=Dictyobacter arantiisoli TaxID=2014874 RepID=A0A5A5TDA7_9CHLR|nr:chemotaxis protein CheW [Dictyobacter arantiisoli]GCF09258.1 hypothetical protein KDI_28220 [Dictyobacter arantiisoli]